ARRSSRWRELARQDASTLNRKRRACQSERRHAADDSPLFMRITAACDLALYPLLHHENHLGLHPRVARQTRPDVLESLAPGATDEQIRAAEEAMGVTLPDDVRANYRIHNGQQDVLVNVTYWPGLRCVPAFLHGEDWASLDRMVEQWRMMKGLLDGGTFDRIKGRPTGPIRSDWWHPMWLPLTEDTTGYVKCLDLAPRRG